MQEIWNKQININIINNTCRVKECLMGNDIFVQDNQGAFSQEVTLHRDLVREWE